MKPQGHKPRIRPPFEDNAMDTIRKRKFKHTLFFYMSLDERRRWMKTPALADFRVFSCGLFEEAHGHSWERSGHDEGVFKYCVAGKGYYRHGGKEWAIGPGDVFYAAPMTHHSYAADTKDPWTVYWMHISGADARHYEKLLGVSIGQPTFHLGMQPEIIYLFNMLYNQFRSVYDIPHMRAISSCAQLILSRIAILIAPAQNFPRQSVKIHEILQTMEASVDDELNLQDFATQAGVTPEHFSRIFKKATGCSPIDYFLRLKIRKACLLLATTDTMVKQIAFQLSFHNPIHFTCLFKKHIGLTPSEYRESIMKKSGGEEEDRKDTQYETSLRK